MLSLTVFRKKIKFRECRSASRYRCPEWTIGTWEHKPCPSRLTAVHFSRPLRESSPNTATGNPSKCLICLTSATSLKTAPLTRRQTSYRYSKTRVRYPQASRMSTSWIRYKPSGSTKNSKFTKTNSGGDGLTRSLSTADLNRPMLSILSLPNKQ